MHKIKFFLNELNISDQDKEKIVGILESIGVNKDIKDDDAIIIISRSLALIQNLSNISDNEKEIAEKLLRRMRNENPCVH